MKNKAQIFRLVLVIFPIICVFSLATADINEGLVGYWNFDEGSGTIAYDYSGNDIHGTLVGATYISDGASNNALSFDGDADYVSLTNDPRLDHPSQTIAYWVRISSTPGYLMATVGDHEGSYGDWGISSYIDLESKGLCIVSNGSSNMNVYLWASQALSPQNWHFIANTWDDATKTARVFVDGALDADSVWNHGLVHGDVTGWYVGVDAGYFDGGLALWFQGDLDEVRIYDRALDEDEIWELYGGENQKPVAVMEIAPNPAANYQGNALEIVYQGYGASQDEIAFDASESFDQDGSIVDYIWSFDGIEYSHNQIFTRTDLEPGTYLVSLTVIDDDQQSDFIEETLTIVNGLVLRPPYGGDWCLDDNMTGHEANYWGNPGTIIYDTTRNASTGYMSAYSEVHPGLDGCNHSSTDFAGHYVVFIPYCDRIKVRANFLTAGGVDKDGFINGGYTQFWYMHISKLTEPGTWAIYEGTPWNWLMKINYDWKFIDHPIDWSVWVDAFAVYMGSFIPGWAEAIMVGFQWLADYLDLEELVAAFLDIDDEKEDVYLETVLNTPADARHNAIGFFVETQAYAWYTLAHTTSARFALLRYVTIEECEGCPLGASIVGLSPIDLVITDPQGRIISKDTCEIPGARHEEVDYDKDGYVDDYIYLPEAELGQYTVFVYPDTVSDADTTTTFSIISNIGGRTEYIAENVSIDSIPTQPLTFRLYYCGDANFDGMVNVSDAVHIINYVFVGGDPPDPLESGDVNCDGICNVSDAVWIINYVFVGGNDPCDTDGDGIPDC